MTIAIGSVLTLLVLPFVLVLGYAVGVARATVGGEDRPPAFEGWGRLLVDGLKALLIAVVYVVVPAAVVAGGLVLLLLPVTVVQGDPTTVPTTGVSGLSAVLLVVTLAVMLVAGVASVASLYVLPAALVRFAETGSTGAAFALRRFWPVLTSGTYTIGRKSVSTCGVPVGPHTSRCFVR